MRPFSGIPRPLLAAVTGHIATAVPRARDAVDLALVETEAVGQQHVRPDHADRLEIGGRAVAVARHRRPGAPSARCCGGGSVRTRCSSATRLSACSSSALQVSSENGMAQARDPPVEPAVPLLDERRGARDGLRAPGSAAASTAPCWSVTHSPRITRMPESS